MMAEAIQVEEVAEFSAEHPGEKFYMLNTPEVSLGFFYVSSDTCTLGWQGKFDFSSLDQEALGRLPSVIEPGWIPKNTEDTARVSLILRAQELMRFDLTQSEQYQQYRQVIENAKGVSFVRYDVQNIARPLPLQYSFTAENPNWQSSLNGELTILVSRLQQWTEDLVGWVFEHHIAGRDLQEQLDPEAMVTTLSNLSGTLEV